MEDEPQNNKNVSLQIIKDYGNSSDSDDSNNSLTSRQSLSKPKRTNESSINTRSMTISATKPVSEVSPNETCLPLHNISDEKSINEEITSNIINDSDIMQPETITIDKQNLLSTNNATIGQSNICKGNEGIDVAGNVMEDSEVILENVSTMDIDVVNEKIESETDDSVGSKDRVLAHFTEPTIVNQNTSNLNTSANSNPGTENISMPSIQSVATEDVLPTVSSDSMDTAFQDDAHKSLDETTTGSSIILKETSGLSDIVLKNNIINASLHGPLAQSPTAPSSSIIDPHISEDADGDCQIIEYRNPEEDSSTESDSSSDDDICEIKEIPESYTSEEEGEGAKAGPIRVRGELSLDDLPPVAELSLTVPAERCKRIGHIVNIVHQLVIVQAEPGSAAVDLDTVLFLDEGSKPLGQVFDVFGPVTEPRYCIRFQCEEHARRQGADVGVSVYVAPNTPHTRYIFLADLLRERGSDASWRDDVEPPPNHIEFSDDEEERRVRRASRQSRTDENNDTTIATTATRTNRRFGAGAARHTAAPRNASDAPVRAHNGPIHGARRPFRPATPGRYSVPMVRPPVFEFRSQQPMHNGHQHPQYNDPFPTVSSPEYHHYNFPPLSAPMPMNFGVGPLVPPPDIPWNVPADAEQFPGFSFGRGRGFAPHQFPTWGRPYDRNNYPPPRPF